MKSLLLLLHLLLPLVAGAQVTWRQIGPYGGNVTRIAADSNGALFAMADNGIYRSGDNGLTWTRGANVPINVTFVSFAIARNGTYFASSANDGVYRSSDRGLTWSGASEGLPQSFAWSIAANPIADEVLVSTGPGVYRTTDDGATWTLTGNERITRPVLFAPDGSAFVAVDSGVMRSSDAARATWTWTDSTATPTPIAGMVLVGTDTLYVGTDGSGVWRSVDGGVTWSSRSTGLTSLDVDAIDHGYAGELYVSTADGGLHRSTDDGELWVRVNPTRVQFVASSILRAPTDRLFATSPKGIFYNDAHAIDEPWNPSRAGINNTVPRTVIAAPDGDLSVLEFTGVFHRASPPAFDWSIVDLDIPPGSAATGMALDSSGALIAAMRDVGLFRSTDEGSTWERFATSLPTTRPTAIAIGSNGHIFVGTSDGSVHRSNDDGATWSTDALGDGSPSAINAIAVRDATVYAGSQNGLSISRDGGLEYQPTGTLVRTYSLAIAPNGEVYAGSFQGRVYRSSDQGATWAYATTTPVAPLIAAIAVNARGDIFAGAQPGGIFLSRDGGVSFTPQQTGLVNPAITSIAFDAAGVAYVGTYGGGVHASTESTTAAPEERTLEGITLAVTPTPAASGATVLLALRTAAHVRLELFDAAGSLLRTLHDGRLGAGIHRTAIDAASLASGAHRVRATVDGAPLSAPLVVQR